jgi:hypothetical protein
MHERFYCEVLALIAILMLVVDRIQLHPKLVVEPTERNRANPRVPKMIPLVM